MVKKAFETKVNIDFPVELNFIHKMLLKIV